METQEYMTKFFKVLSHKQIPRDISTNAVRSIVNEDGKYHHLLDGILDNKPIEYRRIGDSNWRYECGMYFASYGFEYRING